MTGQGFRVDRIRAAACGPGCGPSTSRRCGRRRMSCGAEVHGAFDGSPDLRFVPGAGVAGRLPLRHRHRGRRDAGPADRRCRSSPRPRQPSRVEVTGGTHVPRSPSHHFLSRHWSEVVGRLGLVARCGSSGPASSRAARAASQAEVAPVGAPGDPRPVAAGRARRGPGHRGRGRGCGGTWRGGPRTRRGRTSGSSDGSRPSGRSWTWSPRRRAPSCRWRPCSRTGRAGVRAARPSGACGRRSSGSVRRDGSCKFLDDEEAVVDPWLADQLAVPAGAGGRRGPACRPPR